MRAKTLLLLIMLAFTLHGCSRTQPIPPQPPPENSGEDVKNAGKKRIPGPTPP